MREKPITDAQDSSSAYWDAPKEDPMNTAILYSSFKNPTQCGHAVPLDRMVDRVNQESKLSCPVCGETVAYVEDGLISKKDSLSIITFKYGKLIYRLSIPSQSSGRPNTSASNNSTFLSRLWWMKSNVVFGGMQEQTTAQGRIASVFSFDYISGMKIFSKGKVVYPPPKLKKDVSGTIDHHDLSDKLISISKEQVHQESGKVNFIVSGTTISNQQRMAAREESRRVDKTRQENVKSFWNFMLYIFDKSLDLSRKALVLLATIIHFVWMKTYNGIVRPLIGNSEEDNRDQQSS